MEMKQNTLSTHYVGSVTKGVYIQVISEEVEAMYSDSNKAHQNQFRTSHLTVHVNDKHVGGNLTLVFST